MHSNMRFHKSHFGLNWDPGNVALTVLLVLFFLIFLFFFLTLTAPLAQGQSSIPPTAVQAAKMPQFAWRLGHPVHLTSSQNASRLPVLNQPRASYKNPADLHGRRRGPFDSTDVYDNGPTNGTSDGWTINFGFAVADSFPLANNNTVNGLNFAAWLLPGDVLQSAEVLITSAAFGGTTYFDQTLNFTQSGCVSNQYGYNVCTESGTFSDISLNAGTYWLTLQNASVNTGDPAYWDENSGPSSADGNSIGTIPSESFTILGGTTTSSTYWENYACPPSQEGWNELHDLSQNAASSGAAIDASGNLYGSAAGGSYGQGMLYEVAQKAGHWFFTTLYSFLGGSEGDNPGNLMVGPDGALYGSASGGIQTCGSDGTSFCGVIYKANPNPTPCPNVRCGWNETTLYQFTGNADAWGGNLSAFDSAGNLYGISTSGGIYGQGAVFELTPGAGGWTEKVIYNFVGTSDGANPSSLLVGRDGNLYGTATGPNWGVVFRLVSWDGNWTESVLYTFTNNGPNDGYSPGGLVQDRAGNLYGFSICYNADNFVCGMGWQFDWYGLLFTLQPNRWNTGWNFSVFYDSVYDCQGYHNTYHALAFDSTGMLYAAQGGDDSWCSFQSCYDYYCGQFGYAGGGYFIQGNADIFTNLTVDASGHLYGTVPTCGGLGTPFRDNGMVWEYSPPTK